jgi:hypothetical protein
MCAGEHKGQIVRSKGWPEKVISDSVISNVFLDALPVSGLITDLLITDYFFGPPALDLPTFPLPCYQSGSA